MDTHGAPYAFAWEIATREDTLGSMKPGASQALLPVVLSASLAAGCATYSLPAVRLESPEATGRIHQAELEPLALVSGTDLVSSPVWSQADPEAGTPSEPFAQGTLKPAVGGVFGITERLDVGLRISPQTPPLLRAKYQLSGAPETELRRGNIPVSLAVAAGFLSGQMDGRSTSFVVFDLALPVGYRLNEFHIFYLSPFFGIGSASGLTQSAAQSTPAAAPAGGVSASASQYGAGLGYQFDLKYLDVRAELAYAMGSIEATKIQGLNFGLLFGFEL